MIGDEESDYVSLEIAGLEPGGTSSAAKIEVHCDGWGGSAKGTFVKGELVKFTQATGTKIA